VKVRHDEGVATRIGPEPCAGVHEGVREGAHEGVGEASVGECIGQPLSRESEYPGSRRRSVSGRQYGRARKARALGRPGVVEDPGMCRRSLSLGTGRARVRPLGLKPPVRIGKARSRSR
jgi:hypothetical protein